MVLTRNYVPYGVKINHAKSEIDQKFFRGRPTPFKFNMDISIGCVCLFRFIFTKNWRKIGVTWNFPKMFYIHTPLKLQSFIRIRCMVRPPSWNEEDLLSGFCAISRNMRTTLDLYLPKIGEKSERLETFQKCSIYIPH